MYYDPKNPGSYGGVERLRRETGAPIKQVKSWLQTQEVYTLHRPSRQRLNKDPIIVPGIDYQWGSDVIDVQSLAKENDGVRYLLVVIDTLSKYAWVEPMKSKEGKNVAKALNKIIKESKRCPKVLRTDRGGEYTNRIVQNALTQHSIRHMIADHRTKESISERFIRTIKSRLWRYFRATNGYRYLDVLKDIVTSYNHSVHRTIQRRPVDVTIYNGEDVWRHMYGKMIADKSRYTSDLKIGDRVLISKEKAGFDKGYSRRWVREPFVVKGILGGQRGNFRYKLSDLRGEDIIATFKREELQPMNHKEKIIRKVLKPRDGRKRVVWRGYPNSLITSLNR